MHLRLKNKTQRKSKTGEEYFELTFEYLDGSKVVKYWVWAYVHNNLNSLQHIWDETVKAEEGRVYALHFKKAMIADRLQLVITSLRCVDAPIKFLP